jgi:hypothetical protein
VISWFQAFAFKCNLCRYAVGGLAKSYPYDNCRNPMVSARGVERGVALQVAFERQTLKPVFHLIGYRLWV